MTSIEIGTGLPTGTPTVTEAAREIEELGFESLWVPDLLLGDGTPALEPALTLAAAAAVTEWVKVGFSVLVLPLRPVPWLASQVATLQQLSAGRLVLGVGSGGFSGAPFWRALGVAGEDRRRLTDTALELLPRLLAGEPVDVGGGSPLVQAPGAAMPPVLVGGSEAAFGRVLEYGDGWFPSLVAPADLAPAVARLRERAAAKGVRKPSATVGGHAILGDDASARAAYDSLVRNLVDVHAMPLEVAERVPMRARTPGELAEIFAAYADAGADRVVTGADNVDWRTGTEFIAEARERLG